MAVFATFLTVEWILSQIFSSLGPVHCAVRKEELSMRSYLNHCFKSRAPLMTRFTNMGRQSEAKKLLTFSSNPSRASLACLLRVQDEEEFNGVCEGRASVWGERVLYANSTMAVVEDLALWSRINYAAADTSVSDLIFKRDCAGFGCTCSARRSRVIALYPATHFAKSAQFSMRPRVLCMCLAAGRDVGEARCVGG